MSDDFISQAVIRAISHFSRNRMLLVLLRPIGRTSETSSRYFSSTERKVACSISCGRLIVGISLANRFSRVSAQALACPRRSNVLDSRWTISPSRLTRTSLRYARLPSLRCRVLIVAIQMLLNLMSSVRHESSFRCDIGATCEENLPKGRQNVQNQYKIVNNNLLI